MKSQEIETISPKSPSISLENHSHSHSPTSTTTPNNKYEYDDEEHKTPTPMIVYKSGRDNKKSGSVKCEPPEKSGILPQDKNTTVETVNQNNGNENNFLLKGDEDDSDDSSDCDAPPLPPRNTNNNEKLTPSRENKNNKSVPKISDTTNDDAPLLPFRRNPAISSRTPKKLTPKSSTASTDPKISLKKSGSFKLTTSKLFPKFVSDSNVKSNLPVAPKRPSVPAIPIVRGDVNSDSLPPLPTPPKEMINPEKNNHDMKDNSHNENSSQFPSLPPLPSIPSTLLFSPPSCETSSNKSNNDMSVATPKMFGLSSSAKPYQPRG
jgi:hypothetical protein